MKKWFRRIESFFSYSFAEQKRVFEAFWIVLLIRLALKLLPFQRFRQVYASMLQPSSTDNVSNKRIEQYVWAIQRVSGSLGAVCLPQALALKYFLRKDKQTEIVIGVDKSTDFSAHAWVEKEGKILIGDSPLITFQPIWKWQ